MRPRRKQTLRKILGILGGVTAVALLLVSLAIVGEGDKEFQEMRNYTATHAPKTSMYRN